MNSVSDTKPMITSIFLDNDFSRIIKIIGITDSPKVKYDIVIKNLSGILSKINY